MAQALDERLAFGKAMLGLASALGFELDEPMIAIHWRSLQETPPAIRSEVFAKAALLKWYRFPQPGELRKIAADVVAMKRAEAAKRHLDDCEHSGHFLENSVGRLERCPCWKRAQLAMAEVGQPIALPPAASETPYVP